MTEIPAALILGRRAFSCHTKLEKLHETTF